jgi:YVTN family beta-propeller protein
MPVGVLVRPDGRFAYVANMATHDVAVIDLRTLAVTSHIKTGKTPDGMAWSTIGPGKRPEKAGVKKGDY